MPFKLIHSNTKNAKSRVCQFQVYYLTPTHSSAIKSNKITSRVGDLGHAGRIVDHDSACCPYPKKTPDVFREQISIPSGFLPSMVELKLILRHKISLSATGNYLYHSIWLGCLHKIISYNKPIGFDSH